MKLVANAKSVKKKSVKLRVKLVSERKPTITAKHLRVSHEELKLKEVKKRFPSLSHQEWKV